MLHLDSAPAPDAADALALALAWSFEARGVQLTLPKPI